MGRVQASAWLGALVGGLIGGGFALFGGALADRRMRRNDLIGRVQRAGAAVVSSANLIRSRATQDRRKYLESERASFPVFTIGDAEREYSRAYIELSWMAWTSPIWTAMFALDQAWGNLLAADTATDAEWHAADDAFANQVDQLEAYLRFFAGMRPSYAARYLRSVNLPTPTPAGAAPPNLPPTTLERYWRWAKQHQWAVSLGAALFVAVVGAGLIAGGLVLAGAIVAVFAVPIALTAFFDI